MANMDSPIAIVGMGLRLPGDCHDAASYWDLLVNKRDARRPIPPERFNVDGFSGSLSVKDGYFLDQPIDQFDAAFFSMSQAEVERLDPQQRLFLEVVYEAFENSGETNWRGKDIAVYAASFGADWAQMQGKDLQDRSVYAFTGHDDFVLANRVSYEFDLRGPSMTIRVACSSSLVAMHLACEALQRGDCSGAVVGATNLFLTPENFLAMDKMGVLSPDGSSKSFDASANGYARAEAVNAVYIKRLDDAIRDGNPVRAIIRGTAVNADGKTRGLFSPSSEAHTALIRRAYAKAGILNPEETTVVECHGTGTAAGDPLELAAVSTVLGGEEATYIGSVKPNVGHAEAAAGLNSVIKSVLALERKVILPNIKFNTPNPKIPFSEARLTVPTEAVAWPSDRLQRISVNSFGMGGANAHVIIDAAPSNLEVNGIYNSKPNGTHAPGINGLYPSRLNGSLPAKATESKAGQHLLVFSAHSEVSLQKMISNYSEFIQRESFRLSDLAYTISVRRHHWNVRSFCVSDGKTLQAVPAVKTPKFKGLLFIFTGQGAQWVGMGRELLRDFPTFENDIRKMDVWLAESSHPPSWKIEDLLRDCGDINSAEYAQPICTALQISLVNLLRQWHILPTAVVGHSSGEIAAAYAVGALEMKEALYVSYYRGVATSEIRRPGAMGAIGLGRDDLKGLLVGNTVLACENSRSSTTISGDTEDVEASLDRVSQTRPGVLARKLKVDRAYHSNHMKEVGQRYENLMSSIQPAKTKLSIPFFSSVTGSCIYEASSLGPSYWRLNMESPVLFLSAVESALQAETECNLALEIGPHSTLSGPFRQICKDLEQKLQYLNTLNRGTDCTNTVLTALGQLYCHGVVPDFAELNPAGITMSNLPPYPWNHNVSYWHENRISREFRSREFPEDELLGARVIGGNDLEPSWRKLLDVNSVPWLKDHIVSGDVIFPAAGYLAMIGKAIRQLSKISSFRIRNLSIDAAMILRTGKPTEIITRLQPHRIRSKLQSSSWYSFTVSSYDGSKWISNCSGEVRSGQSLGQSMFPQDVDAIRAVNSTDWYRVSKSVGLEWGPFFQALENIRCGVKRPAVVAEVRGQDLPEESYAVHPIAIDQLLQCCIIGSIQGQLRNMTKLVLPIHIGEVHFEVRESQADLQLRTEITSRHASSVFANGQIQDKNGTVVMECRDIQFRVLEHMTKDTIDHDALHKLQLLEWRPDIDLTDANQLIHRTSDLASCVELLEKLHILCSIETTRKLKNAKTSQHHIRRLKRWNEEFLTTIERHGSTVVQNTEYLFQINPEDRQALIRKLLDDALASPAKFVALAITRLYDAAEEIFHGKTDALAVLLADDVLTNTYNFNNMFDHEQLFQLLGHSNPGMRILEIGAGTGGFTSTVLPTLNKPGLGCMYSTYTYTDISSGFFKAAKERFGEYPHLEFVKLDISKDVVTQGFEHNSYDLVIAANILHATPNLGNTLKNCRSLLRPGGRLIMLELGSDVKFPNYIMGHFPDWWLGESDGRPNEPTLLPAQWDTALRKAGFVGVEASITDQVPPYHINSMIVTRSLQPEVSSRTQLSFLVSDLSAVDERTRTIQADFESDGYDVSLCSLSDLPSAATDVISLLDIDSSTPFFQDLSETRFRGLIELIRTCYNRGSKILWLTGPAQILTKNPYHAMILGLARTLRLELGSVFATMEFDTNEISLPQRNSIVQVFRKLQAKGNAGYSSLDCEFAFANGNVCIPRLVTSSVDGLLRQNLESTQATKRLFVTNPGQLNSLQWGLQLRGVLQDNEVEIEVRRAWLNSWDFDVATGITHSTDNLGLECTGMVSRVGPSVKNDFQPGDFVLCWSPGSLATHVKIDAKYCVKLPNNLTSGEPVISPTVYATMIRGLKELCNLDLEETVLIHSAAAAEGIAAIQIARMIGAKIFVTVATDEQKVLLEKQYGMPSSHIFSSKDNSFVSRILQITNGRGVDVVVNTLSGDLFFESCKCVAEGGSMIDLSKWDSAHESFDRSILGENRNFYSFDIVTMLQQKPMLAQRLLRTVVDLFQSGSIQPISPIAEFDPIEIKENFHLLHPGRRIGTACINFPEDPTAFRADFYAEKIRFRADRAYILVGGFGGLGKAAALWLAERGAGSVIFLSRSASEQAAANATLLCELENLGCSVQIVTGSVTDMKTVENLIANATKSIAGVLHLPLVNRDKPLLEMSHSDWEAPISSKVNGAWNLHHALRNHTLDFFVLLSSMYAVRGNHGQANYSAANNFLDAFVQYRRELNLPASTIDLGALDDIGHVADRPELMNSMKRKGALFIGEDDFLESLELAIQSSNLPVCKAPSISSSFVNRAQFVVGGIQHPLDARGQALAGIFQESKNGVAGEEETSSSSNESNSMEKFMHDVKKDPMSLHNDVEGTVAFLAAQIFEAVKSLLVFDNDDDEELNESSNMADLAIDSLMAIELQNWWRQSMGTQVSVIELTQGTSAVELGKVARDRLLEQLMVAS